MEALFDHGIHAIYTDGGVCGRNPSSVGGSWCWVAINMSEEVVRFDEGIVTPTQIGLSVVTNNYTELLAAVQAMEILPLGWCNTLYTDSMVTRQRLVNSRAGFKGIPDELRHRLEAARSFLGNFRVVLLDGHPTRAQLLAGKGKRGQPVSQWNVLCDKHCTSLCATLRACPAEMAPYLD